MNPSLLSNVRQRILKSSSGSVWALDVLMALLILLLLNMLALQSSSNAMVKARTTQSLSAIRVPHQVALIEHYAHTGEWLDSDVGLQSDVVDAGARNTPAGGDAAESVLSGRGPARAVRGKGDDVKVEVGATTAGISDGVIVTLGIYSGFEGVAMLGVRPAVIDAPEQPVVMWLCGRAPTPAGWQSPLAVAPTNLPNPLLFSICRGKATS